jgi:hypothetical protein
VFVTPLLPHAIDSAAAIAAANRRAPARVTLECGYKRRSTGATEE